TCRSTPMASWAATRAAARPSPPRPARRRSSRRRPTSARSRPAVFTDARRLPGARPCRAGAGGLSVRCTLTEGRRPMRAEMENVVGAVEKSLKLLGQRMDWETAPHRLEEMNAMIEDGDLWADPARAQKLMRDRQMLLDQVETYRRIERDLKDNVDLIELGEMEDDREVVAEA